MAAVTSLSSVDSSKSRAKRQYIVKRSPDKAVDESLFGPPARFKMMSGNRTWTASSSAGQDLFQGHPTTKKKEDVVEVITKDLIRNLKVPITPDPSGISVIIEQREFDRIRTQAIVFDDRERKEMEEKRKRERNQKNEDVNERKKLMQKLEDERKKNMKLSDLEQTEAEHGAEISARAKMQLEENDDQIKKLNELLLNAKCHAIRDKQLDEKKEIYKQYEDEEKRLDTLMEAERLKKIQEYENREKERHIQQLSGAQVIHKQIEDREIQRMLDKEKKDQETQQLLQYMERLQKEDWDNLQKKRVAQRDLMEEVAKCNEEMKQQKLKLREQEKLEELKILDYIKKKQAREEELQKELEQQKAEKEMEVARLRAQQEKAKDKEAERDALRAKRNQEEREREWRRKEKEDALKKAETDMMLKEAREDQVKIKEHFLAVQAQRERSEFNRVLK
jgi:phenylpyruvate tautomerase PptA (4-oxalocrotonate tautomerase family)